jgi:citrate synthase
MEPTVKFGSEEDFHRAWIRLLATVPCIVATHERLRRGLEPIAPDSQLDTAANFLWMLNGQKPADVATRALDCALVLHADHTMNASTFAARVVYGTNAGPYDSVSAAIGALHGPLHGGANEKVLQELESIGGVGKVREFAEKKFAAKGKIMGFGHRVYKAYDPRATHLKVLAKQLAQDTGNMALYDKSTAIEKTMATAVAAKGIYPNVDFYSATTYHCIGLPLDLFTPSFVIARAGGWSAHCIEQLSDNRLFRPDADYTGPHAVAYAGIDKR